VLQAGSGRNIRNRISFHRVHVGGSGKRDLAGNSTAHARCEGVGEQTWHAGQLSWMHTLHMTAPNLIHLTCALPLTSFAFFSFLCIFQSVTARVAELETQVRDLRRILQSAGLLPAPVCESTIEMPGIPSALSQSISPRPAFSKSGVQVRLHSGDSSIQPDSERTPSASASTSAPAPSDAFALTSPSECQAAVLASAPQTSTVASAAEVHLQTV
jgi:hypothetical protein